MVDPKFIEFFLPMNKKHPIVVLRGFYFLAGDPPEIGCESCDS